MESMRLEGPRPACESPLQDVTLDDPVPAPGDVLINVGACGVCRTDLQLSEGDLPAHTLPIIPGHQIVGEVKAIGEGVTEHAVDDRVGVAWIAGTCGTCRFCTSGRENLCDEATFTGWDRDGGYAQLATARADFAYAIPEGTTDLAAAPLMCGGVIGYRSMRVAGIQPGMRVGLYGFGASATCVIQIARHWDCEVYVATRSEDEQARARDLGATWAGGYEEKPPVPLDAAITFAPVGDVVIDALKAVDKGGTVAINAIHLDRVPEFNYDLLWWERVLRSVANVTRQDVRELLRLAGEIPIVTQTQAFALDSANEALQAIDEGRIAGSAVLTP